MSLASLGRTLVIANPAAQSGAGEQAARAVEEELARIARDLGDAQAYEVVSTEHRGHATEIARAAAAQGFSTVVALGGDGVIHEVANGLMSVEPQRRPALGIIPIGSGNDYARTLGVRANKPLEALGQLLAGKAVPHDVGRVNGTFFVETLSFGIDAAIALGTMQSRKANGAHGTVLYASSGIEVFTKQWKTHAYTARLFNDAGEEKTIRDRGLIFAVQIGPTYGGGFKICPEAQPTDGLFDICRSVVEPSLVHALVVFFAARLGLHRLSRIVGFERAKRLVIDFEDEPPCQADGEGLSGTHFEIDCLMSALRVVAPGR